jgi:hypothetical protein
MKVTRRSLIRGLLVVLGVDPVALWRRRGRGDKAAAAPPTPLVAPSPTAMLSAAVIEDLLAFGELVVEGRALSPVERRYLAEHIEDRAQQEAGYYISLYLTTVEYLTKLAGARFSELDLDQRIALAARHRLMSSRVLPDEDLGPFPEEVRAVRTQVIPDLISGYYTSPAGWAIVGYDTFPGRCGDLARYTGPER